MHLNACGIEKVDWLACKVTGFRRKGGRNFTIVKSMMNFVLYTTIIREDFSFHWYGFEMDLMVWMQSGNRNNALFNYGEEYHASTCQGKGVSL